MFRKSKTPASAGRERFVSLVMLPAFLLGTAPYPVCVCQGDQRQPCCPFAVRAFCGQMEIGKAPDRGQGRAPNQPRSCCQATHEQSTLPKSSPVSERVAKAGTCCQLVIQVPDAAGIAEKAGSGLKSVVNAATQLPTAHCVAANEPRQFRPSLLSTPPPLDAVVVYLHLTI